MGGDRATASATRSTAWRAAVGDTFHTTWHRGTSPIDGFRCWSADGTWNQLHDRQRELVRVAEGRDPQPSAAILDSQTAHSHQGGDAIGGDAGKRTRGRKRHLLVDVGGLLLRAVVHAASVQERAGAKLVLAGITSTFPLLGLVWADAGYANHVDQGLLAWAREHAGVELQIVPRNADVKASRCYPAAGWWNGLSPGRTVQTVGPRL